jgi:DNA-binding NarL/FixJ family response regulator
MNNDALKKYSVLTETFDYQSVFPELTKCQARIIVLSSMGVPRKTIATWLEISTKSITAHIEKAKVRLNIYSKYELSVFCLLRITLKSQ